jgi:hypothetical protein
MIRRLLGRLRTQPGEAGLTLIELLVASTMSVILVGASTAMLISAVKDQPALSRKSENVTTARWQLERIVREIRNGVSVEVATPSEVTIVTRVREVACGSSAPTSPGAEAIKCKVTYRCSETTCTRTEATLDGFPVGTTTVALSGVSNPSSVFCFVPSTAADPTECGTPQQVEKPTYVGINIEVPNPDGPHGLMTISDGATLRTATLSG